MIQIAVRNQSYGALVYAERPLLADPHIKPSRATLYDVDERAAVVTAAIESGVTLFLASRPEDAQTLDEALSAACAPMHARVAVEVGQSLETLDDRFEAGHDLIRSQVATLLASPLGRRIDIVLLNDVSEATYDTKCCAGAISALVKLRETGEIGAWGVTSYRDYEAAAQIVARDLPDVVFARCNAADLGALRLLAPRCAEASIPFIATQTIAWAKGVPFVRFSNTWRLRNMLMNFYGVSAVQAHLRWIMNARYVDGVACAMNEPGHPSELAASVGDKLLPPPPGMETAFSEFLSAITRSDAGWTDMLTDTYWEYRLAAFDLLGP